MCLAIPVGFLLIVVLAGLTLLHMMDKPGPGGNAELLIKCFRMLEEDPKGSAEKSAAPAASAPRARTSS